jgi:hypothetical protein
MPDGGGVFIRGEMAAAPNRTCSSTGVQLVMLPEGVLWWVVVVVQCGHHSIYMSRHHCHIICPNIN